MKLRSIIIGLIAFICIVASVQILLDIFIQSPAPNVISNIRNLKPYKRKWIKRTFVRIHLNKDISNPAILGDPYCLKYYGNDLYVANNEAGTISIKRFSKNGKFLNSIGNGEGRGPGQFALILDYFVKDSTIWIIDGYQLTLSTFSITGRYKNSYVLKYNCFRIVPYDHNKLVIQILSNAKLFCLYSKTGKLLNRFGVLASNQLENPLSFNGLLLPSPNKGFMYVSSYASLIYYYSTRDTIQKIVTTPDGQPFTAAINKTMNNQRQSFAPSPKAVTMDACIDHGILYLDTMIKKKAGRLRPGQLKIKKGILDCYNWKTGRYLDSIRLPFVPSYIQVKGDTLYGLFTDTGKIKAYKMIKV